MSIAIDADALAGRIAALSQANIDRLNELLASGSWEAALNLINAIDADARSVSRSCSALAGKVNRRHWSPLLQPPEAAADPEVA